MRLRTYPCGYFDIGCRFSSRWVFGIRCRIQGRISFWIWYIVSDSNNLQPRDCYQRTSGMGTDCVKSQEGWSLTLQQRNTVHILTKVWSWHGVQTKDSFETTTCMQLTWIGMFAFSIRKSWFVGWLVVSLNFHFYFTCPFKGAVFLLKFHLCKLGLIVDMKPTGGTWKRFLCWMILLPKRRV